MNHVFQRGPWSLRLKPSPLFARLIACHGLQAHYQRCKKWTEILEEKRRPTLLESHRGKEASKKSEDGFWTDFS
eukprot:g4530.t1